MVGLLPICGVFAQGLNPSLFTLTIFRIGSKRQHLQEIHATLDESLEQLFALQAQIEAGG